MYALIEFAIDLSFFSKIAKDEGEPVDSL